MLCLINPLHSKLLGSKVVEHHARDSRTGLRESLLLSVALLLSTLAHLPVQHELHTPAAPRIRLRACPQLTSPTCHAWIFYLILACFQKLQG
jgi:hypothetical protein